MRPGRPSDSALTGRVAAALAGRAAIAWSQTSPPERGVDRAVFVPGEHAPGRSGERRFTHARASKRRLGIDDAGDAPRPRRRPRDATAPEKIHGCRRRQRFLAAGSLTIRAAGGRTLRCVAIRCVGRTGALSRWRNHRLRQRRERQAADPAEEGLAEALPGLRASDTAGRPPALVQAEHAKRRRMESRPPIGSITSLTKISSGECTGR